MVFGGGDPRKLDRNGEQSQSRALLGRMPSCPKKKKVKLGSDEREGLGLEGLGVGGKK